MWFVRLESEFEAYRNQLWTAPELLRMTTRPNNGTQKADVYSFAIIVQEIMFRAMPYFYDDLDLKCRLYLINMFYVSGCFDRSLRLAFLTMVSTCIVLTAT